MSKSEERGHEWARGVGMCGEWVSTGKEGGAAGTRAPSPAGVTGLLQKATVEIHPHTSAVNHPTPHPQFLFSSSSLPFLLRFPAFQPLLTFLPPLSSGQRKWKGGRAWEAEGGFTRGRQISSTGKGDSGREDKVEGRIETRKWRTGEGVEEGRRGEGVEGRGRGAEDVRQTRRRY